MAKYKLTAFGMDCVPRISRAQVFDALSSMGNISGMICRDFSIFRFYLKIQICIAMRIDGNQIGEKIGENLVSHPNKKSNCIYI